MEKRNGDQTKELLEAEAHILKYTLNYVTSMSLRCAVQLGIPDIIFQQGQPITLTGLIKALGSSPIRSDQLYRLMRILVNAGFFVVTKPLEPEAEEGYALTLSSKLLSKSHSTSIAPLLLMFTDPVMVTRFHNISALFQGSGSTPIEEAANGMSFYDYCGRHTEFNKIFNDGMASDSKFVMSMLLKDHKVMFEGARSLVDVAGGTGTAAKAISEVFPSMQITVLDLPHVVSDAKGNQNLKFVAGDMFESIPAADIAFIKCIMLDWPDEECVKILKRCKEAICSNEGQGKVIIIDFVLDQPNDRFQSSEPSLCCDIMMMAIIAERQRTESEWKKLIKEAGFKSYKLTHALGLRSIIEVFP